MLELIDKNHCPADDSHLTEPVPKHSKCLFLPLYPIINMCIQAVKINGIGAPSCSTRSRRRFPFSDQKKWLTFTPLFNMI